MLESVSGIVPVGMKEERFDLVAAMVFPALSRKQIKAIIDRGGAYVNKRRVAVAKHRVKAGDKLELFWEGARGEKNLEGNRKPFLKMAKGPTFGNENVLFDGPGFLVINKPAQVATQATLTSSTETVLHAIHRLDAQKYPLPSLRLVHRLDKDTTGLLLVARTAEWQKFLEDSFRLRHITKVYEALTFHIPRNPEGSITFPIAKDPFRPNTYVPVLQDKPRGHAKSAETTYQVLAAYSSTDCAHVKCEPKTGRTHQIRVHLMGIGCPILGDRTYARNVVGHPLGQVAGRQMLHARSLTFRGLDEVEYDFEAPLPEDFAQCLKIAQAGR